MARSSEHGLINDPVLKDKYPNSKHMLFREYKDNMVEYTLVIRTLTNMTTHMSNFTAPTAATNNEVRKGLLDNMRML